jgi:hypothetical protein
MDVNTYLVLQEWWNMAKDITAFWMPDSLKLKAWCSGRRAKAGDDES